MRAAYDINAQWNDPWDHRDEHRATSRFVTTFRVNLSVNDVRLQGTLVGPGRVQNISLGGAYLLTKHDLKPGQHAMMDIPTDLCPENMGMPKAFIGPVEVIRVEVLDDRRRMVAIRFGDQLTQNMEFAVFIDYLQALSTVMNG